jgi:putative ABC transport system permease protein
MIKNYFLITLRSMMKNKLFIIINVFGMGIAIAICIVTYLAYQYDATFDAVHKNRESIYRISSVREFENTVTRFGYAPLPLAEIVDKTFEDVDLSSPYLTSGSNFKRGNDLFAANIAYVDPEFFRMFSFEFIARIDDNLTRSDVFISENVARRLFPTVEEALGKTVTQVYGTKVKEIKITGVFREPPMNSSFYRRNGSAYMHLENYKDEYNRVLPADWNTTATLFIQVNNRSRLGSVDKQVQAFIDNNNQVREDFQIAEFKLDPLTTLAHRDRDDNVQAVTWQAPPIAAIVGSVIMGILILLIACFNLTNTAIAISSRRLKEIGIRKVMGSQRIQLIMQFIGETTVICFLALVVGLPFSGFLIKGWNIMTNNNIHLDSNYYDTPGLLSFLLIVLLITAMLAGSYPAFYISKFKPISILKGKLKFGGTNYFTRTLLGLQFAISLMAVVSAIAFMQNARYQRDYDLGFDVRGSVIAFVDDQKEFDTYRDALQFNPEILSIAGAKSGIFSNRLHEPVTHHSSHAEVDIIEVGDNYLKTMDLKIIEGRDFIKDSETDQRESIIITERMAELFKWHNPIGKEIIWKDSVKLFVVGVVKNVYTHGLWREMEPMMIRYVRPEQYTQIIVSTRAENVVGVNAYMNKEWNNVFPNRLYNGNMLGSAVQEVSALNTSIMYGYAFLGLIAMILSATGLYSLLSLNIIKRMKEIGIRKIVGASVFNITRIVNTEFAIILGMATALGSLASYNWCNIIMSSIWKYHQGVNILTFMISIGLLFAVSLITIAHKVFVVARMNPVNILRDE